MANVNVKNTIVERVLNILAPYPCYQCGKIGSLLCERCKHNIESESFYGCIECGRPSLVGVCEHHDTPYERSFVVSGRTGSMKQLIDDYKFKRVRAARDVLAHLLNTRIPRLPENTQVVPVPTNSRHIRQRGYDQVELLVGEFAKMRQLQVSKLVRRNKNTVQHGASKEVRSRQARLAYSLATNEMLSGKTYLLVDDIITTGATVREIAALLRNRGAKVFVAALAYQPLD